MSKNDCDLCKRINVELYHNEYTGLSVCEDCDLTIDNGPACRKAVYDALQSHTGVVLGAAEVVGLWRTILDDSVELCKLREHRAPLVEVSRLRSGDRIIIPSSNADRGGYAIVTVSSVEDGRVYVQESKSGFPIWTGIDGRAAKLGA